MQHASSKPRRDDPHARRDRILDETIRVIGERGYYGFTIQELAKRCSLSNAGLLYHFGSKDVLLVAALEELKRREEAFIAPVVDRVLRVHKIQPGAIFELFQAILTMAAAEPEHRRLTSILRAEALDPTHPAHSAIRTRDAAALNLFETLLEPHYANADKVARWVSAVLEGLGEHWIRSNQGFDLVEECLSALHLMLPNLSAQQGKPLRPK